MLIICGIYINQSKFDHTSSISKTQQIYRHIKTVVYSFCHGTCYIDYIRNTYLCVCVRQVGERLWCGGEGCADVMGH